MLIFGDADQVPVRYAWIPDGYDDTGDSDGSVVETDLYYADLDYSWDDNGDGKWGDLGNDTVDGVPDLYVGRLPASTIDEASKLINKIQNYNPINKWFMKYLLLGTDTFGGHEGEILKDYIQSNLLWANFSYTKLYESASSLIVENAMKEIDRGYGFINFAGHGNYYCWSFGEGGIYYDANASSQVNGNFSVIFAMACLTARFSDRNCIGEAFLLNSDGGGIAYYGASRVAWGYSGEYITDGLAGEIDWRFTEALFNCLNQSTSQEPYAGTVWGIALANYAMNHPLSTEYDGYYLDWKTLAEYGTLLGDPTTYLKGVGAPPPLVIVSTNKQWYSSNENIKVTTNITVDGSAVTGADVTAYIYDPNGNEVASLSLHDDGASGDATPNDGIYTGIYSGLPSSATLGTYRLRVSANITGYGVETDETSFIFIGGNNLLVEIYNTYDEHAPYVDINVLDQSTGSIVRFGDRADENGIYYTNLPNGTYAIMAWSGESYRYYSGRTDNFFVLEKNIQIDTDTVTVVQLNASTGASLTIQAYNINSQPQEDFWIDLYLSIGGFGLDVAQTDSSGQAVIYVTPEIYHIAARYYGVISYYLYMLNIDCTSSSTVVFQPTPETTSNLTLLLRKVAENQYGWAYIHPQSLPSPFGFDYCDEVIVTPDEWDVWSAYTYLWLENGDWSYDLWCEPTRVFNLTIPGSAAIFNFGGSLQFMLSVNGSYSPGDTVQIFWNLTDSYGNVVDHIYESTEHVSGSAIMVKIYGEKRIFTDSGRVEPLAYQEHYPYLTILDPNGSPIVTTDVYWQEKPKQYVLSEDAANGTYTVKMSINTGPWQDIITISDIFTVEETTLTVSDVSIVNAPANTVYFIFADPAYMTRAEATYDVASGSIIYGLCINPQHLGFDTTKNWLLPSGAINTTTISGSVVAMFGGPCPHVAVRYYENAGLSPVRFASNSTHCMFLNQTDDVVAALPMISVASGHEDMFIIEVFTDGTNTFFVAYGFDWRGTWAGGIYYKEVILNNLNEYHESYCIFHWIDDSGDGVPQISEIFEEASG